MLNRIWIARLLPVLFFGSFLLVGLTIYRTFGVHIDEYNNQEFGTMWGQYVDRVFSSGNIPLVDDRVVDEHVSHNLCHGPFWEISLYYIQKLFVRDDASPRETILRARKKLIVTLSCNA
jgi:hypothetical protein